MVARAGPGETPIAKHRLRQQYAALPLIVNADGQRRVMLVTSRETRRWIIPKGWAEKNLEPFALAAKEAFEEAGLQGAIGGQPVGRYRYAKQLRGRKATKVVECDVLVFPLAVERQLDDWPEKGQRETRWFTPAEAALAVDEGGLAAILRDLDALQAGAVAPERWTDTADLLARCSAAMTGGELAQAQRWIAEAETHLTRQRQHIERWAALGHDTTDATLLQRLLEQFLAIAQAYRRLVLAIEAGKRPEQAIVGAS